MKPSDQLHDLALPDGGKIVADVTCRPGIRITRFDTKLREQAALQLDYPYAGFGGGGWIISPSGNLLLLDYYSGQSEETFVLLNLANGGLIVVAHPEYHFGEYASYAFSPDEDKVIMVLPRNCVEWWQHWEDDGLELADDGVEVLPFATLLMCSTDRGQIHRTEVELVPTVPSPIHMDEYDPDLSPHLFANSELSLQLPWASVQLDLSNAPTRIRIPYPPNSDK